MANVYALDASEVREIIKMNRNGIRPESLKFEPEPELPEFVTAVGDDSITRFDNIGRKRKKKNRKGRSGDAARPAEEKPRDEAQQAEARPQGERRSGDRRRRRPDGPRQKEQE